MRLDQLKKGHRAHILHIHASWEQKRRLLELGFVPGSQVEALGRAPLSGPLVIRCRGTKIALRSQDAAYIELEEVHKCA